MDSKDMNGMEMAGKGGIMDKTEMTKMNIVMKDCIKRTMKIIPLLLLALVSTLMTAHGSENVLTTIYQPLDPLVDGSVVVREVPFVTGGTFPEIFFTAITQPHIPQQQTPSAEGDINVASRAGVSLQGESASAGQKKLYITWDFTKADRKLVNKDLINALLVCLERTAGKSTILYSKFVGADDLADFRKIIEAKFPPQTAQQLEEDSHAPSNK